MKRYKLRKISRISQSNFFHYGKKLRLRQKMVFLLKRASNGSFTLVSGMRKFQTFSTCHGRFFKLWFSLRAEKSRVSIECELLRVKHAIPILCTIL